jgi:hypothetical protein
MGLGSSAAQRSDNPATRSDARRTVPEQDHFDAHGRDGIERVQRLLLDASADPDRSTIEWHGEGRMTALFDVLTTRYAVGD